MPAPFWINQWSPPTPALRFRIWVPQVVPDHQLSPNRFVLSYIFSQHFIPTDFCLLIRGTVFQIPPTPSAEPCAWYKTNTDRPGDRNRQKGTEPPTAKSPLWVIEGVVSGVRCGPCAWDGTATRVKDRTQCIRWSKNQQECFDVRNWKSSQTLLWPVAQRRSRPSL